MAAFRLTLVLFVLTALQADAVQLSLFDIRENGAASAGPNTRLPANVEAPGESLADISELVGVQKFADTIAGLASDVGLRIGIRVRAGGPQSGEPYVGRPVLEPGTMFLMGFGLLGISVWARRRWARRR
jgi:hypothetical protein